MSEVVNTATAQYTRTLDVFACEDSTQSPPFSTTVLLNLGLLPVIVACTTGSTASVQQENAAIASEELPEQEPEQEPEPEPPPTLLERVDACPSDEVGSLRDLWVWDPSGLERDLVNLDLTSEDVKVSILGIPASTIIFRIKDAASDNEFAVMKTNTAGTEPQSEVYAWRLSSFLGFSDLVSMSVPYTIQGPAVDTLSQTLKHTKFRQEWKQENLDEYRTSLRATKTAGESKSVVLKPWLRDFVYNYQIGSRQNLRIHRAYRHLQATHEQPTRDKITLRQNDEYYETKGEHEGWIWLDDLTHQVSQIMLLDALIANQDRFPGGNMHMISLHGSVDLEPTKETDIRYQMGEVHLLALDNGSSLMDHENIGLKDIKGESKPSIGISRFHRDAVRRARILAQRVNGWGCKHPGFADEREAIWHTYFGLNKKRATTAEKGLILTLEYIDALHKVHGDAIYFDVQQ